MSQSLNTPFASLNLNPDSGVAVAQVEKETVSTEAGRKVEVVKETIPGVRKEVQQLLDAVAAVQRYATKDATGRIMKRLRSGDLGSEVDQVRNTSDLMTLIGRLGTPTSVRKAKTKISYSFPLPEGYRAVAFWVPFSTLSKDESKKVQPVWNADRKKVDFFAPGLKAKATSEIWFDVYSNSDGCPMRWGVTPQPKSREDSWVMLGVSPKKD